MRNGFDQLVDLPLDVQAAVRVLLVDGLPRKFLDLRSLLLSVGARSESQLSLGGQPESQQSIELR
jgi:hypothetical protein